MLVENGRERKNATEESEKYGSKRERRIWLRECNGREATAPSSSLIRDLVINLVKICDADIVKLTSRDTCMYMKPSTILFLFKLERCIEHAYFWLY